MNGVQKCIEVKTDIYFKCLRSVDSCYTHKQLTSAEKLVDLFDKHYSGYDLEGVYRLRYAIKRSKKFLDSLTGLEPAL